MMSSSTIAIHLPDGSVREVPAGTTPLDIANSISPRLAAASIVFYALLEHYANTTRGTAAFGAALAVAPVLAAWLLVARRTSRPRLSLLLHWRYYADPPEFFTVLAGDTDGVDGAEEVAGAIVSPDTLARAKALGISAKTRLADNDGHGFFEALGDQVITGPTLTNVNDFRAILITA